MTRSLLSRLADSLRARGLKETLRYYAGRAALKLNAIEDVAATRLRLAEHFNQVFDATVQYGPFSGFRFTATSWWSDINRASMLFGFYEQEVLNALVSASRERSVFIDIGAADGYYAVAAVSQGLFDQSHAFEISEQGRSMIRENALLNGVADQISIHGEADASELAMIPEAQRNDAVVLIDIEGAEFAFLTAGVVELLKRAIVIIELHEWLLDDGSERLVELRERAAEHFTVTVLTTSIRDLSAYPELDTVSDSERWLLCSEGRGRRMQWWVLSPMRPV